MDGVSVERSSREGSDNGSSSEFFDKEPFIVPKPGNEEASPRFKKRLFPNN